MKRANTTSVYKPAESTVVIKKVKIISKYHSVSSSSGSSSGSSSDSDSSESSSDSSSNEHRAIVAKKAKLCPASKVQQKAAQKKMQHALALADSTDSTAENLPVEFKACSKGRNCKTSSSQPLPVKLFTIKRSNRGGLRNECKNCEKHSRKQYADSEHGFLNILLHSAKKHTKERNASGERNLEFTLTLQQLKAKVTQQQRRCALTGHLMTFKPHSTWRCSIERIDNSIGYTDANTVLIIAEMNTANQWTAAKVNHLFSYMQYSQVQYTDELQKAVTENRKKRRKWPINDNSTVYCHYCRETKDLAHFYKLLSSGCKACAADRKATYRDTTWYGALKIMHDDAKSNSIKKRKMSFDIELQQFIDIFRQQGGLCAYSGKPMTISGDFKASPERLNTMLSYTADSGVRGNADFVPANLCFVCQEFNSIDHTRVRTESSNDGSSGWSKQKFEYMQHFVHQQRQ